MVDLTISQLTQVQPKGTLLVPAVDMSAPVGAKNVAVALGSIWGGVNVGFGSGAPSEAVTGPALYVDVGGAKGGILWVNQTGAGWVAIA